MWAAHACEKLSHKVINMRRASWLLFLLQLWLFRRCTGSCTCVLSIPVLKSHPHSFYIH